MNRKRGEIQAQRAFFERGSLGWWGGSTALVGGLDFLKRREIWEDGESL